MLAAKRERAGAYIRALVSGFAEPKRSNRALLMLQAFIDDSGNGQGSVFVLAGFIAPASVWEKFSDEWEESLGMYPAVPYFHMTETEDLFGNERKNERITRFYRIIEEHAVYGLSSAVSRDAYEKIFKNSPKPLNDPYFLLFFDLIAQLARHGEKLGISDEVDFIFDEQLGKKDKLIAAWDKFKRMTPPELLKFMGDTPSFKDDKKVKPLQAADLYAWWLRRNIEEDVRGLPRTPFPWKMKREIPGLAVRWNYESLERVRDILFGKEIPPEVLFQLGLPQGLRLKPFEADDFPKG